MPAKRPPKPRDQELFRGDHVRGVAIPEPAADASIVRHILYLDGAGRPTPYTSTTHDRAIARTFSRPRGRIWETSVQQAQIHGAAHLPLDELLQNLRGKGHGARFAGRPSEVAQARVYAERHCEHLLDWRAVHPTEIADHVRALFR